MTTNLFTVHNERDVTKSIFPPKVMHAFKETGSRGVLLEDKGAIFFRQHRPRQCRVGGGHDCEVTLPSRSKT